MITSDDNLLGLWAMMIDDTSDFLGAVYKASLGYVFEYRIRYYVDDKIFSDSKDIKNWYRTSPRNEDFETYLKRLRAVIGILTQHANGQLYEVLRNGRSTDEFMKEFTSLPFIHMEKLSDEEAEKRFPHLKEKLAKSRTKP